MGWRPYGEPAVALHELLAAEVFRLWEKTRKALDPGAEGIPDDLPICISPAPNKFGDAHTPDVQVTLKAGDLRLACREKRKRASAIYDKLCADPNVLAGTLEEAPADALSPLNKMPEKSPVYLGKDLGSGGPSRAGTFRSTAGEDDGGAAAAATAATPIGPRSPTCPRVENAARDNLEGIDHRALSNLLSTLASRCGREFNGAAGGTAQQASTSCSSSAAAKAASKMSHQQSEHEDDHAKRISAGGGAGDGGGGSGDHPFDEGPVAKRPRLNGSIAAASNGTARESGSDGAPLPAPAGGGSSLPGLPLSIAAMSVGNGGGAAAPTAAASAVAPAPLSASTPASVTPQTPASAAGSPAAVPNATETDEAASAARRQLWYWEVQANDSRLRAIKEEAEREHAVRMRQLMSWIVDEEGGKHNGLGGKAGPGPANWERH